jgi:hypothetical protein
MRIIFDITRSGWGYMNTIVCFLLLPFSKRANVV